MTSTERIESMRRRMLRETQAAIDRMRLQHARRLVELQAQINECVRQQKLCQERLKELG
ncbi:hypothetical protein LCGC14_3154620 [marine sediment metagenome]|uniref:Uncharacterized protein n=1 Tax=marine sediment metagenome TaxID=412755 RepID=A0A0F8YHI7_9ZZZZ